MAYQVTVQYPNGQQLTFKFEKDSVYFGRLEGNDIRLAHSYVSSRHFMIQQQRGSFFVQDIGSTNGTLVNGQLLEPQTPHAVGLSDVIQVGPLEIRLEPIVDATVIERTPSRIAQTPPEAELPAPAATRPPPPLPRAAAGRQDSAFDRAAARTSYEEVPADSPSPMWKIQTGIFRAQGDSVRLDDQAVAQPRGEIVDSGNRPGLEAALRVIPAVATAEPGVAALPLSSLAGGLFAQVFGLAIVAACLAVLVAVILL